MKNYIGLLLISLLSLTFSSFGKVPETPEMDSVLIALKAGNAGLLSRFFDNRVDLSFPGKTDNFSRNQAEMVVRDFFNNTGVKNFEVKHSGEKNGSTYCVGILHTRNGNYRTTLFMKQKGDKEYVQELSFQSER